MEIGAAHIIAVNHGQPGLLRGRLQHLAIEWNMRFVHSPIHQFLRRSDPARHIRDRRDQQSSGLEEAREGRQTMRCIGEMLHHAHGNDNVEPLLQFRVWRERVGEVDLARYSLAGQNFPRFLAALLGIIDASDRKSEFFGEMGKPDRTGAANLEQRSAWLKRSEQFSEYLVVLPVQVRSVTQIDSLRQIAVRPKVAPVNRAGFVQRRHGGPLIREFDYGTSPCPCGPVNMSFRLSSLSSVGVGLLAGELLLWREG